MEIWEGPDYGGKSRYDDGFDSARMIGIVILVMLILLIGIGMAALLASEQEPEVTFHQVSVTRIIDGDTFDASIDLRETLGLTVHRRVRIRALDCPEMRGEERVNGQIAREHLSTLLTEAGPVTLRAYGRDSFGRLIAEVVVGGINVVPEMIAGGCQEWP